MSLTGPALRDRLVALTAALSDGEAWWRTRPFRERRLPWEAHHTALSAWVRGLDDAGLWAVEQDPIGAVAPWADRARLLRPLLQVDALPAAPRAPAATRRVREHKQQQVAAFVAVAAPAFMQAEGVVEWCSGRGHLGRALAAALDRPARLLERDPALCRPPADLDEDPRCVHHAVDVLDDRVSALLPPRWAHVGLHACGSLTDRILVLAVEADAHAVLAAPCCYHRLVNADVYAPRSALGRSLDLRLHRDDLRIATRDAREAGERRRRLLRAELLGRSAWDLLRRAQTGRDQHHGLGPTVGVRWDRPLPTLLADLAAAEGVQLPAFDADALHAEATARVREIRALELPRLLYRRAIELWVNLDRALALQDAGYTVTLGTFCEADDTPRNLAVLATR